MLINGDSLSLAQLREISCGNVRVELTPDALARMASGRAHIDALLARGETVYGVNTGFGRLSDVSIPDHQLGELQLNLVRSHACGFGKPLSIAQSRVMLALRANVLAKGHSGARPEIAQLLVEMLNRGVVPVIPSRGSVGASGDLAPLAHLALVVIGEGEAWLNGGRMGGGEAMAKAGLTPIVLEAKEGLALLNGTQAITAVGTLALERCRVLLRLGTLAGALSLEGLMGTPVAFDERIHSIRGQQGQMEVAAWLRNCLSNSEIRDSHVEGDSRVQDAYALRCMPQVHGAAADALRFAIDLFERESGAATDNPLVFENGDIISGGNFHGAPVAIAADVAGIAIVQAMSIAERRIERLTNPDESDGLPPFLAANAGLESGLMIAHVSVAAALNEARVLAHPASVDNTPTSAGKEDHVSMGMTAALKLSALTELWSQVVATELAAGSAAVHCRAPLKPGEALRPLLNAVAEIFPPIKGDRVFGPEIEALSLAILDGKFDSFTQFTS